MNRGELVGPSIFLPPTAKDWLVLVLLLVVISLLLVRVADRWTAALGVSIALITYDVDKQFYLPLTLAFVSLLALVTGVKCRNENPRNRAVREGLLVGGGFLLYENGRSLFVGGEAAALSNSDLVSTLEKRLHLFFEPTIQRPFLDHESLLRFINGIYSWAYLPFVLGAFFWLYLSDEPTFKIMRNALGVSIVLAIATIALFPVAPPRLALSDGLVDTHVLLGKVHGFVNPHAAIPSFHVGWTALSGYMLFQSIKGKIRWFWAVVPVAIMSLTVIITGNHYWIDGLVGSAFTLVPVLMMSRLPAWNSARLRQGLQAIRLSTWADRSIVALGVLWLYLVVRQIVDPGFTHYWGYMVAQITATIVILVAMEIHFTAEGGLSWLTYVVATVATWADTLGTAAGMYSRYSWYDKIIHFGGGVAITAVAADLLFAHRRKRGLAKEIRQTFLIAALISLSLNVGWEIYEYLGDRVFSTGRHAGWIDTTYDLISDSLGILVALVLLSYIEPRRFDLDNQPLTFRASAHRLVPGIAKSPTSERESSVDQRTHRPLTHRLLRCGFMLPIVFVAFVWIAAAFTPGYSHISDTVSDLAEQGRAYAYIMRIGILTCATLLALFTTGLLRVIPTHRRAIGVELFGASLMLAVAAVFQDWGPDPGSKRNLEGMVHTIAATAMIGLVISFMVTMLIVTKTESAPSPLRAIFRPSIGFIVAMIFCCIVFVLGPGHIDGLAQRGLFFTALTWLVMLTDGALHTDSSSAEHSREASGKTPSMPGDRPAHSGAAAKLG